MVFNREVRPESSERRTLAAGRVQLRSSAPMPRRRRGILTATHSNVLLRMSFARASSETGIILKFNSSVPIGEIQIPEIPAIFPAKSGRERAPAEIRRCRGLVCTLVQTRRRAPPPVASAPPSQ